MINRFSRIAIIFALVCATASAIPARADDKVAHITVYSAGVVEVLEERTIEMQAGANSIEWRSLMPKAYVSTIRVIAEGCDVVRQHVTYDGAEVRNERAPVLHVVLQNKGAAGPKRVQVDYLAPDLDWQNDYSLVLDQTSAGAPPQSAMLDSWVTLFNRTGSDISAGTVDIVAGDIAFLIGDRQYQRRDLEVAQRASNVLDAMPPSEPSVEATGLSAFARFRLGSNLTMNANAPVNRFPLFQKARLAVTQRNIFENEYNAQTLARGGFMMLPRGLEVRLVSKNTTGLTMPAGMVSIYATTDRISQVAGQDRIGLVPPNGEFSVSQGRSSTLFGTRRILERREVSYRGPDGKQRDMLVTKIEVTLTNRGSQSAEAFIREGVEPFGDNQWTVTESSTQSEKLAANSLQFKVTVPAGGKTTVTYTLETK